jgi:RND family efflux transporter MFP subunit
MKKSVKRIIVLAVVAVVLVGLGVAYSSFSSAAAEALRPVTPTLELRPVTLTRSVSASGTVGSERTYNVYSQLQYTVHSVEAAEGQRVEQGDVLAKLDTESLELDIRAQRAALDSAKRSTGLDLDGKAMAYENAQERTALTVDTARRSYQLLAAQVANGTHPELVSTQNSADNAKAELDARQRAYDDNKLLFDLGELSRQTLDSAQTALDNARRLYDSALQTQQNTQKRLRDDVETARKSYSNAQVTAAQEVENAKTALDSAQAVASTEQQEITLEKLEKQLRDSTITAPISGVVTKVYAKEGSPGSGLLFIIEDLEALEISTKVKEYDAALVSPGLPVIIRSDATGDAEITGTVKSVAPTSEKNAQGGTISANVVEYVTLVTVSQPDSGLKIGMNTRMNIVLETRENVLSVPYDAVFEDADGALKLYVLDEASGADAASRATAKAVPVTVGLETDFAVEVSGPDLREGLRVITDPASVTDGAEVKLQ